MGTTATVSRETSNGTKLRPIDGGPVEPLTRTVVMIDLDQVDIGPNVRVNVEGVEDLAESIKAHGVLQPIKARPEGDRWIVVWGQRRVLAARLAGLERIPALTTADEPTPEQLAAEQLVENLHRADLNPMDRARAMKAVVDSGVSQADLARELGLAPSTIANDLRLLGVDDEVQAKVETGEISPTHARTIASLPAKQQREIAVRITREKLSTHRLEQEIEWKRDEATRDEAKAAKIARWIPKAIAALEVAKIDKTTLVSVHGGYYDLDVDAVRAGIKKAGWKVDTEYHLERPEGCDCDAVRLEVGGRKAEIKPICTDARHRDRATNLAHLARERAEAEWAAQNAQLVEAAIPALRAIPSGLLRIIDYRLERSTGRYLTWEEVAKLDVEDLVAKAAETLRQNWGMRDVDQAAVLRELGIAPATLEDEPATPAEEQLAAAVEAFQATVAAHNAEAQPEADLDGDPGVEPLTSIPVDVAIGDKVALGGTTYAVDELLAGTGTRKAVARLSAGRQHRNVTVAALVWSTDDEAWILASTARKKEGSRG